VHEVRRRSTASSSTVCSSSAVVIVCTDSFSDTEQRAVEQRAVEFVVLRAAAAGPRQVNKEQGNTIEAKMGYGQRLVSAHAVWQGLISAHAA
jgi:hypothetical protein